MNQKTKSSFLEKLFLRLFAKVPLAVWFRKNLRAILWNMRYRIILLFLDLGLVIFLLYLLPYSLNYSSNTSLANQFFVLGIYVFLLFLPVTYGWRSSVQILYEVGLNASIVDVRADIKHLREQESEKDILFLQVDMNKVRINLKDFISVSSILSPPIYNYELDRVHKGIDIFFNSVSEVLFPVKQPFSRAQAIERQQTLEYYQSQEHPTEEEAAEEYEEMQKSEMGEIDWFNRYALDEFMQYLGDALFEKTKPFSPFSFRHPINLIRLSGFIENWNSVVSCCGNCRVAFEKAQKDIEEYYKSMGQRRQRFRRLTDDILVVIVSVVLSVVLSKLI